MAFGGRKKKKEEFALTEPTEVPEIEAPIDDKEDLETEIRAIGSGNVEEQIRSTKSNVQDIQAQIDRLESIKSTQESTEEKPKYVKVVKELPIEYQRYGRDDKNNLFIYMTMEEALEHHINK